MNQGGPITSDHSLQSKETIQSLAVVCKGSFRRHDGWWGNQEKSFNTDQNVSAVWNCAVERWVRKTTGSHHQGLNHSDCLTPKSSLWVPVPTRWRASAVQASAPAVCSSPSAFSSPRSFTLSKGYTCLAAGSLFLAALPGQSNAGKREIIVIFTLELSLDIIIIVTSASSFPGARNIFAIGQ